MSINANYELGLTQELVDLVNKNKNNNINLPRFYFMTKNPIEIES